MLLSCIAKSPELKPENTGAEGKKKKKESETWNTKAFCSPPVTAQWEFQGILNHPLGLVLSFAGSHFRIPVGNSRLVHRDDSPWPLEPGRCFLWDEL